MDIEKLKMFCSKEEEFFPTLLRPFEQDGFVWATDGRTLVGMEGTAGFDKSDKPNVKSLLESNPKISGDGFAIPEINTSWVCGQYDEEEETCRCVECGGRGSVYFQNEYSQYGCECNSCDGAGYLTFCPECEGTHIHLNYRIPIGGAEFYAGAIYKLSQLPNARIFPTGKLSIAHVRFDGGIGLVMPSDPEK